MKHVNEKGIQVGLAFSNIFPMSFKVRDVSLGSFWVEVIEEQREVRACGIIELTIEGSSIRQSRRWRHLKAKDSEVIETGGFGTSRGRGWS